MKNETEILGLINSIQAQLIVLDKKVDTLIDRSLPQAKESAKPQPSVNNIRQRTMYTAICADCKKECSIPFKPTGDRPVYCQDCFSRRKVIKMSGMSVADKPQVDIPQPEAKKKKKVVTAKKPVAKKKPAPKKK